MRVARARWLVLAVAAALGCGDGGSVPAGDAARAIDDVAPEPVALQTLNWNAAMTDLGAIAAVVASGDDVAVFGERGMQWLSGGAVFAHDPSVMQWRDAASVPAGDGSDGRWVVAIDGAGHVWRVRDRMTLEDVTGRYGLSDQMVRSVAVLDATRVVFGTDEGFAVADGTRVLRWNDPSFATLVAGGTRIATRTVAGARAFDVTTQRFVDFAVTGATAAAVDADGKLVVGTATGGVWREQADGALAPGAPTTTGAVGSVARAGTRLWVIAGGALGVFDETEGVRLAAGVSVANDARLVGSDDGSVWVVGAGTIARYALSVDARVNQWEQEIRPIFARRCTPCHLPGGTANVNLTRYQFWVNESDVIRQVVLVQQRMPPPPATITADERATIARWLDAEDAGAEAGVDAGAMDAGAMDAAVADAGAMDAGVTDRGPADSGPRDAGVADRGAVDSGARDVVATDSGPRDVAATDSGPRDATVVDSGARDAGAVDSGVRDAGAVDGGPLDVGAADGGVVDAGGGFAAVYPIIQRVCVTCHGASGGLNMSSEATAYANLVGVAAMGSGCGASGLTRVVAGDSANSLLYLKIRGGTAPPCGTAMPRGLPTLPAADIATVRAWIETGAPR